MKQTNAQQEARRKAYKQFADELEAAGFEVKFIGTDDRPTVHLEGQLAFQRLVRATGVDVLWFESEERYSVSPRVPLA